MKYKLLIILSMIFILCGCAKDAEGSVPAASGESDTDVTTVGSEEEEEKKSYTYMLGNPDKPETVSVTVYGNCSGKLKSHVRMVDLYGIDYISSGVVGLVGSPVEISTDGKADDLEISFEYDPDLLHGMPETNLIVLYCNSSSEVISYKQLKSAVVDTDENTVTVDFKNDGIYLLADAYQWLDAWGKDASEYAYDIDLNGYISQWERECDTGSIMELADKEWAMNNAPDFHVSTAEELASVVYHINAFSDGSESYTITLEDDIDLEGYDWKPIGWTSPSGSYAFCGVVDGGGHTINGMHIEVGYVQCGFIGYGPDTVMRNISFTNAYLSTTRCAGIAGGEVYYTHVWENVHTQGEIYCEDDDNSSFGAIAATPSSITFIDCSADVTVNGEPFEYFTYSEMIQASVEVVEYFTLTLDYDYSITRNEVEGFDDLTWIIKHDGVQILARNADSELVLDPDYQWMDGTSGTHTVYLAAFMDGTYIRISNIIEYTL